MKKNNLIIVLLYVALLIIMLASLCIGAVTIKPSNIFDKMYGSIIQLRAARVWMGLMAGAALGIAGMLLQGVLRNPLADPYVLGISSGAGVGAVLTMMFAAGGVLSLSLLPGISFIFGVLTIMLVIGIAKANGKIPIQTLLLSGIIVGSVLSSILLFLVSLSRTTAINDAIWWLLGSLQVCSMPLLFCVTGIVIVGLGIAFCFTRDLNVIALGEEDAMHLGINIEKVKKIIFLTSSLLTGAIVCSSGIIGFVGLIIPHLARLLVGAEHRKLFAAIIPLGGSFMILCDTVSRTLILPAEIPIGAITALVGGPFFIYLLRMRGGVRFR